MVDAVVPAVASSEHVSAIVANKVVSSFSKLHALQNISLPKLDWDGAQHREGDLESFFKISREDVESTQALTRGVLNGLRELAQQAGHLGITLEAPDDEYAAAYFRTIFGEPGVFTVERLETIGGALLSKVESNLTAITHKIPTLAKKFDEGIKVRNQMYKQMFGGLPSSGNVSEMSRAHTAFSDIAKSALGENWADNPDWYQDAIFTFQAFGFKPPTLVGHVGL
jgi:hypothetical protein